MKKKIKKTKKNENENGKKINSSINELEYLEDHSNYKSNKEHFESNKLTNQSY